MAPLGVGELAVAAQSVAWREREMRAVVVAMGGAGATEILGDRCCWPRPRAMRGG